MVKLIQIYDSFLTLRLGYSGHRNNFLLLCGPYTFVPTFQCIPVSLFHW